MNTASVRSVLVVDPLSYTPYYDLNLCDALIAQGWKVEWLTTPYMFEPIAAPSHVPVTHCFQGLSATLTKTFKWIDSADVVRRGIKAMSYPFDLVQLDRELSSRAPGILHVQWALLPVIDQIFWRRWRQKGWKIVYTAHDVSGLDGTTPGIIARSNRYLFKLADSVVVHSERDRTELIRLGADASRVQRLPQGSPGMFKAAPVSREKARRELGIDEARPCILFFGLLKAYKSLDVLLDAVALVRRRIPNVLLCIVGKPLGDASRYSRLIAQHGLTESVKWERSYVPSAGAGLHFASANVVALPYRAASSSAVLLNAYAHSRAVVATKVGAFPEMVEHGVTGLLVPPDSPGELADALVDLLSDRSRADEMGAKAREYALRHHEWPLIARLTGEAYRALG